MIKVENSDTMDEVIEEFGIIHDSGENVEIGGVHITTNEEIKSDIAKKNTQNVKVEKKKVDDVASSNSTLCSKTSENEPDTEINENYDILEEYKNCYLAKFGDLNEYSRKVKVLEDELAAYEDNGSDGTLNDDIRVFKKIASKYLLDEDLIEFYAKQMEDPPSNKNTLQCLYDHFSKNKQ